MKLSTRVSTKKQLILPKAVREQRKRSTGTKLVVEDSEEGVLLGKAPLFAPTTIGQALGILAYKGRAKSIVEMNEALETEARRRARD